MLDRQPPDCKSLRRGMPGHRKCGQHNLAPNNMHQEERKFIHLLAMLADIESEVIQESYSEISNYQLFAAEMAKGQGASQLHVLFKMR
ncbi:hypothetical protein AVEN_218355-1 [Araneus ventricosus]|uniref:Uncharacterized protein n=1 Tax=Araneus ventricosus TaxID=182803 RepID=A0A4Y2TFW2_ARAVE|nr:hypothetical protein AVEN_218355-1 [Araneus ventricosus]